MTKPTGATMEPPRDSRCECLYDPADELGSEEPEESEDVDADDEE